MTDARSFQANDGSTSSCGRRSQTASTACRSRPSSTRRYSAATAASAPISSRWSRSGESCDQQTFQTRVRRKIQSVHCSIFNSILIPILGLLCDLLWSDPDKDVQGWGENDRGVSFTFGADVVSKFLNRHDLDLICRAHQVSLASFDKIAVSNCRDICCFRR